MTSYTGNAATTTLEATGAGSALTLANLASVTEGANNYPAQTQFEALAGGTVTLSALKTINTGTVVLESDGTGSVLNVAALTSFAEANGWTDSTLQASNGGTVVDPGLSQLNGVNLIGSSTGTFTISPSLGLTISGGTSTVQTGTLVDEGNLSVQAGATLNIEGALSVNGSGILTTAPGSTIEISGDLLGTTQNADDFNPQGTVELDSGTGTSNPPQELEAMSADLGAVQAGFVNNFAYGTISLTSDTSVELVDLSHNTTSTSPEAVYANELIVPSGATLNLNNLHLYVRGDQISGTIVGGTVTVVPAGGSIALNTPTPGTLTPAGRDPKIGRSTARRGNRSRSSSTPAAAASNPAISPLLNWGQVALLERERRRPRDGEQHELRSHRVDQRLCTAGQRHLYDPGSGTPGRELQHRQLCPRGLQRHAQRQLVDRQPVVHRHDRRAPTASTSMTSSAPPASRSS